MSDITQVLSAIDRGDPQAAEQLLPLVYDHLRKLAAARLAHEKPGQTLQATALVHEAYLRLVGSGDDRGQKTEDRENASGTGGLSSVSCPLSPVSFSSRGHFFAAAATAMRRILLEQARRKNRIRHGGGAARVELLESEIAAPMPAEELLALDEALQRFAAEEPQKARLVELRFFVGLTNEEAAEMLGISAVTAKRHWRYARAWLHQAVADGEGENSDSAKNSQPA